LSRATFQEIARLEKKAADAANRQVDCRICLDAFWCRRVNEHANQSAVRTVNGRAANHTPRIATHGAIDAALASEPVKGGRNVQRVLLAPILSTVRSPNAPPLNMIPGRLRSSPYSLLPGTVQPKQARRRRAQTLQCLRRNHGL